MRIAVIGAGTSGIVAARVLLRFGHEVVVFERSDAIGGVWARAYPEVRLQNVAEHYRLGDVPWPFVPDLHPTAAQIRAYLAAVVAHAGIDIRTRHEVVAMREQPGGWLVEHRSPDGGDGRAAFDHVVIAVGHYGHGKDAAGLPGRARFAGAVLTEHDIDNLDALAGKDIAVVGFGKSAVDMAAFAAERGSRVHHVFRAPRWMMPRHMLGKHMAEVVFARMSTALMPAWVHPSPAEAWLHAHLQPVVDGFWRLLALGVRAQMGLHGLWRDPEVRRRVALLVPEEPLPYHLRASLALAPDSYMPAVIAGRILPGRGEVAGLSEHGLDLVDGRAVPCDTVILAVGHKGHSFPYLPAHLRPLLEGEPDGVQLYRHILHPRIPHLSFAGFNHGLLHVPGVEMATLWLCAHLRGDLVLPPVEDMERSIAHVRDWKRQNVLFEATRSCGVAGRFHQYLDVLLADLGVRPYRKAGLLAELVGAYTAADYGGVLDEYERVRGAPRAPLPLST
jgi:NADPH-dependent 2,4-dienoyl-CoA reductase/sulfur reductase-like enzyme